MKPKTHPKYEVVTIKCMGCQTLIRTRSTKCQDFSIDVCSNCHPFYTGRQKYVDSAGRIERFQKKWAKMSGASATPAGAAKTEPNQDAAADKA